MPAIDRQGQSAADAGVVKRLALVVRGYQSAAIPIALLHRDLVAECCDELVARGGWEAAKLDCSAIAADCADPKRLLVGENAGKPVKVGESFVVVIGIASSGY